MAEGTFTRAARDHDLDYGYAFAGTLTGTCPDHLPEPALAVRPGTRRAGP